MVFKGKGLVLHDGKVYKFVGGLLETDNQEFVEKLIKKYEVSDHGRKTEQGNESRQEVEGKQEKVDYANMTNAELKEILDDRGIEFSNRASKSELMGLIK